ncbi:RNA methyltransferase [Weissella coleopterorum]|uniref:RNA methyltransferase n=1 Tax=Weissella coleopterorum TaxID=2714949 RepID=A0A6G8B1N2_9LACO|nr:RNA methyltransferase [Weissella coleopterorum]QIL51218.1 RNA methyltransferase [Weissella coleopterorum]
MTEIDLNHSNDYRNVTDYYKNMSDEAIRADLDDKRNAAVSIMQNLTHDFNKATAVRNSNAFATRKLIFLNPVNQSFPDRTEGSKKWDRRGSVGTYNYEHIEHHRVTDYQAVFDQLHTEGYTIYAIDNIESYHPTNLFETQLDQKAAFIFGEEQIGLADELIAAADAMLFIPQAGSVRSLNVSVAHGIVLAFYAAQHPNL